MKRRIYTVAMSAIIAASMAMSSPVTTFAAEDPGIHDVLDNIFGGDKPEYNPDANQDAPKYEGGQEVSADESKNSFGPVDGSSSSSNDSGNSGSSGNASNSDNSGSSGNTGGSGNTSSSGNSGDSGNTSGTGNTTGSSSSSNSGSQTSDPSIHDVLDNMFGGNKPSYNSDDYADAPVYEGGQEVSAEDSKNSFGPVDSTAVTVVSFAVQATDPSVTAVFPNGALYAVTPEGAVYFHSIDTNGSTYNVWHNGQVADLFTVADASGTPVAISNPDVLYMNGKCYVSLSVPETTQGVQIVASDAQKSAFTRLFGVDGVIINGVLVEEFLDTAVN